MKDNSIKIIKFPEHPESDAISYERYPISLESIRYNLDANSIRLFEGHNLNFKLISPLFVEHVKALISDRLSKNAETTVFNYFKHLNTYLRIDNEGDIEESLKKTFVKLVSNKSIPPETKTYLREAYRFFAEENMPFFDQDFVDFYLDEISFGSGNKGLDVIVEMKNRGCLTIAEQRKFKSSFKSIDLYQLNLMELQGYIALKIGQLTGARDCQVRRLKIKHFGKQSNNGEITYFIKIPRAKQRGQNRNQLITRPITNRLGEHVEFLIRRYKDIENVSDDHFLLCKMSSSRTSISNSILTSALLGSRINQIRAKLGIDFTVNLRRLRKTFCSSLIARGASKNLVAFLMDHSDLQQLDVYYRQTHSVAKKLNGVLLKEAGDLLDAFAGKIIKQGEESLKGQAVFAPVSDSKLIKIGSCSSGKLCSLNPPLSCYGCKSLEAFEDAEHSEVLDQMLANAKDTFGEQHSLELAQSKYFLAAGALINVIEGGEYE